MISSPRSAAAGLFLLASCTKVPLVDIQAYFGLSDASWFAAEETLFLFYEIYAQQGISDQSVVEVTFTTDDGVVDWTPLSELAWVHPHVPVDCGKEMLCGSASVRVPLPPRDVHLRMRYHRDGQLALDTETVLNVVEAGPVFKNRSFLVYGVFDETNQWVQWRGRHQFPTLRNQQAEALGLRRKFTVRDQRFGSDELGTAANPYRYGVACPDTWAGTTLPELTTEDRARFNLAVLPEGAADASAVCAEVTVVDGTGEFTTGALARKNPEVRPAFPELRSPVHDATPLPFFLGPCESTISDEHEEMQRQRLQLGDVPTTCTDDWQSPGFVDELVVKFRDAVEAARPAGDDMVLVVAVHRDDPAVSELVEEALAQVAPDERLRSSPRLAGAFVLDSAAHELTVSELSPVTLWCPSTLPLDELPDMSARSCPILPDNPDLALGPFSFGMLPILPTRKQYLDFIDTYSENQAGEVDSLAFRTPEFSALADHVPLGDFGAVTFLNNERISADDDDAFSFCVQDESQAGFVVYRSGLLEFLATREQTEAVCLALGIPLELCAYASAGLTFVEILPDWHNVVRESSYELGVLWEFPYLLRMNYHMSFAGQVTAFGFSVPFGIGSPAESYYGTPLWTEEQIPLEKELTQCTRFCDHPTFDSAGVYHVTDPFRSTYAHGCYLPALPKPGDSGFPLDP